MDTDQDDLEPRLNRLRDQITNLRLEIQNLGIRVCGWDAEPPAGPFETDGPVIPSAAKDLRVRGRIRS